MDLLPLSVEKCLPSGVICYRVVNYELSRIVALCFNPLAVSSEISLSYGMIQCIMCSPGSKGLKVPGMTLEAWQGGIEHAGIHGGAIQRMQQESMGQRSS